MAPIVAAIDHRFADLDLERGVLDAIGAELRDGRGLTREQALDACADADAVIVGARLRIDGQALAGMQRCKVIVRYGVGVDNVDVQAATATGTWVAFVPDYCIEEVADHALALLLALNRRVGTLDAAVRAGRWGIPEGLQVARLSHSSLGVVGFGRIGEALGRRATALGMTVLAHDPVRPAAEIAAADAEPVDLEELLRRADYVSLHMPQTSERPILDAQRLTSMKPGACLINVARGGLVDEAVLVELLRAGALGGAALDVAAAEPLRPPDPLLDAPNVILTPHAAWYSLDAVRELRTKAAQEVARVLAGQPPLHPANALGDGHA